jgi:hypothetical protein
MRIFYEVQRQNSLKTLLTALAFVTLDVSNHVLNNDKGFFDRSDDEWLMFGGFTLLLLSFGLWSHSKKLEVSIDESEFTAHLRNSFRRSIVIPLANVVYASVRLVDTPKKERNADDGYVCKENYDIRINGDYAIVICLKSKTKYVIGTQRPDEVRDALKFVGIKIV